MREFNSLLMRQIKKSKVNLDHCTDPEMERFLNLISESYDAADEERELMERSFIISSREYQESIDRIKMLQAQLIHNEKLAGIGQLSAGIAHEINNPLGFVQSNLDTLKNNAEKIRGLYALTKEIGDQIDTLEPEVLREKIQELHLFLTKGHIDYILLDMDDLTDETIEGINRIKKIVKSLLGFTRKGYDDEFAGYDLNKGIRETLTIATNELKYHVKVIQTLGDIPTVPALGGEINQVLLNLILNAGYAIKEKCVDGLITIRTYSDGQSVYCEIADDGMGISESHVGRIFEPFYTTKPIGVGTGLGLSIAHDIIVNKHKGTIEVSSEPGCGSTFKLSLPIEGTILEDIQTPD